VGAGPLGGGSPQEKIGEVSEWIPVGGVHLVPLCRILGKMQEKCVHGNTLLASVIPFRGAEASPATSGSPGIVNQSRELRTRPCGIVSRKGLSPTRFPRKGLRSMPLGRGRCKDGLKPELQLATGSDRDLPGGRHGSSGMARRSHELRTRPCGIVSFRYIVCSEIERRTQARGPKFIHPLP
jgi:hypothetical protein